MTGEHHRRRRMILLKFKPEVPDADIDALMEKIHANFSGIDGLRELEMGPQTTDLCDYTHAITFVLEDEDALRAYRDDATHQSLREDYFELLEATVTAEIHVA